MTGSTSYDGASIYLIGDINKGTNNLNKSTYHEYMKIHWGDFYDGVIKHYKMNNNSIANPAVEAFFRADSDYNLHCADE